MAIRDDNSSIRFRYETKVPLQHQQYRDLKPVLFEMGLYPRKAYPDRLVHSIYLDTPELDSYHDSVAGISRRSKIRLRWYGIEPGNLTLEEKRKIGTVSDKRTIELNNPDKLIPRDRYALQSLLGKNTLESFVRISPAYQPTLEVTYGRSYLVFSSGIRMTIDRDIRYRKLWPSSSQTMRRSPVDCVLEFKYSINQKKEFGHLLRSFPFRIFRHSKYVVGIDSVAVG